MPFQIKTQGRGLEIHTSQGYPHRFRPARGQGLLVRADHKTPFAQSSLLPAGHQDQADLFAAIGAGGQVMRQVVAHRYLEHAGPWWLGRNRQGQASGEPGHAFQIDVVAAGGFFFFKGDQQV